MIKVWFSGYYILIQLVYVIDVIMPSNLGSLLLLDKLKEFQIVYYLFMFTYVGHCKLNSWVGLFIFYYLPMTLVTWVDFAILGWDCLFFTIYRWL